MRRDAAIRATTSPGARPANPSAASPGTSPRTVTTGGPATLLARYRTVTRPPFAHAPGLAATTRKPSVHSALANSAGPDTRRTHAVRPWFSKNPRSAYGVADVPSGGPNAPTTSFQLSTRTGRPTGPRRVRPRNTATSVRNGSSPVAARSKVRETPGSAALVMSARSRVDHEALDGQHERLHGDLVLGRVERRSGVLRRPGPVEVPPHDLLAVLVEHHDRAGRAPHAAVEGFLHPVPEADVAGDPALERQGARGLLQPYELADGDVLAAGAVLDHRQFHVQSAGFGERSAHRDAVVADVGHDDQEVVRGIRVVPRHRGHLPCLSVVRRAGARGSSAGSGRSRTPPGTRAPPRSRR